jgi:hypothetical protein
LAPAVFSFAPGATGPVKPVLCPTITSAHDPVAASSPAATTRLRKCHIFGFIRFSSPVPYGALTV